jgi:hypothetical protein
MTDVAHWWLATIDFPAMVFMALLLVGLWVLWKSQQAADFDLKDMLRDDRGKPSSSRFAVFVSLAGTTWALMYHVVYTKGQISWVIFLGYALIWSASPALIKVADGYFQKQAGGSLPPPPTQTEPDR